MVKNFTTLIMLPLLLFLEVGIGPLYNFLENEPLPGSLSLQIGAVQPNPGTPGVCPVCQFLQISFLLSFVLLFASFRSRREKIAVRELNFPAQPRKIVASRGPPSY